MITKTDKNNSKTIIEFGEGDIRISGGVRSGSGYISFTEAEYPRKIGATEDSIYNSIAEMLFNPVTLKFNNVESLQVVIDKLVKIQKMMLDKI